MATDKKTKKRLEVLRQKIEKAQKLLAACKLQPDEPDEIANAEAAIEKLAEAGVLVEKRRT